MYGRDPFNQNSDRSDREKWSTSKGGLIFSKLFRLDWTYPLSWTEISGNFGWVNRAYRLSKKGEVHQRDILTRAGRATRVYCLARLQSYWFCRHIWFDSEHGLLLLFPSFSFMGLSVRKALYWFCFYSFPKVRKPVFCQRSLWTFSVSVYCVQICHLSNA